MPVPGKEKYMEISVKTSKIENSDNGIKGLATISFGDVFKVQSVSVMEGKNGLFVSMPSYKTKQVDDEGKAVFKDICNPTTKEFRSELFDAILKSFEKGREVKFTLDNGKDTPDIGVKVAPLEKGGSTKALGRIYINDVLVVSNVAVKEGKNGLFVSMPSYKTSEVDENGKAVYKDICYPSDKDFRAKIHHEVVENYLGTITGVKAPTERAPSNDGFMPVSEDEELPFVNGEEPLEISYGKEEKTEAKKSSPQKKDKESSKSSIKDKLAAGEAKKNAKQAEKAAEPKTPKVKNAEIA